MQTEPDRYSGEDIRFMGKSDESVSDKRVNIHKSEWYRVRQSLQPFVSEYSICCRGDGRLFCVLYCRKGYHMQSGFCRPEEFFYIRFYARALFCL